MSDIAQKIDLGSLPLPALTAFMQSLGQPAYRAGQVYRWLHQRNCSAFSAMSDLPAALRTQLEQTAALNFAKIRKRLVSSMDNTVKYLYIYRDGQCVEGVRMVYRHGVSLCVSTQAGCRMGCGFCASTLAGLKRNLTPYEMLSQVYAAELDSRARVDSLVLMGIGEPLDNYDNVLQFLRMLSGPEGHNLSLRHVSLSTCGLVDGIDRLAGERLQLTLSVSLHAPNDALRQQLMPVARRWSIDELLAACRRYIAATGRRISFEYALVDGVNDSPDCAEELAGRLRGMLCHVNLIPVNAVPERGYTGSDRQRVERFVQVLEQRRIPATVRRRLGGDINAACGQLRREETTRMDPDAPDGADRAANR